MTEGYAHLAPSHKVKALDVLDSVLNERQAVADIFYTGTAGILIR
jgi:hypothetical protein